MPHLRRNTRIRSIHSSLRIEANSLTADQVRDVIDGKPVAGPALEAADSPYVGRLLACMAPGVSYSAVQLLTLLGLNSRQTLRMHYLDPAIREGLLEMTISEKPSSRNQRYRRAES